ncbi:hypothetical protein Tco_1463405 [Tanacetum coccineum]
MQAILDTNPGSTCILDEKEIEHGELLTAIERDANNQMYPIAWAVVKIHIRIYHKNRGRSERIFNQKMKKRRFIPNGEGSTTDKAFSL